MTVDYYVYIASDEWKQTRAKCLDRASNRCIICGDAEILQAHHKTYARLGKELDTDLAAVCIRCHHAIHGEPYYKSFMRCKTCQEYGITISSPNDDWIRFVCNDNHINEIRI